MKKIFNSKLFIAILFLFIGFGFAGIILLFSSYNISIASKYKGNDNYLGPKNNIDSTLNELKKNFTNRDKVFDDFFNDDFFKNHLDPFEEMNRMRKHMQDSLDSFNKGFENSFEGWFSNRFGGGSAQDFQTREDEDFIYYDIEVEGLNGQDVNVKIENKNVTVAGNIQKTEEKEDQGFKRKESYSSSFQRRFPVPGDVDSDNAQVDVKKERIIIKFPKLKR